MSDWINVWVAVWRWRWWRHAGAEIARRGVSETTQADSDGVERLRAHMQRVQRVARWVPRSRCLDRALALVEWADAQGIPAQLCLGVLRVGASNESAHLRAHAWVQSGAIILDPNPAATAEFIVLEAPPARNLEFDR